MNTITLVMDKEYVSFEKTSNYGSKEYIRYWVEASMKKQLREREKRIKAI